MKLKNVNRALAIFSGAFLVACADAYNDEMTGINSREPMQQPVQQHMQYPQQRPHMQSANVQPYAVAPMLPSVSQHTGNAIQHPLTGTQYIQLRHVQSSAPAYDIERMQQLQQQYNQSRSLPQQYNQNQQQHMQMPYNQYNQNMPMQQNMQQYMQQNNGMTNRIPVQPYQSTTQTNNLPQGAYSTYPQGNYYQQPYQQQNPVTTYSAQNTDSKRTFIRKDIADQGYLMNGDIIVK